MQRRCIIAGILISMASCTYSAGEADIISEENEYPYPGWNLVFKASRGNNQSVFGLWASEEFTAKPTPLQTALNSHCGCHFKSIFVERWASLEIKKVAVALYEEGELLPAKVAYFDGEHTNKMNWFDKMRLRGSSWTDLTRASMTDAFSVPGPMSKNNPFRRFIINAQEYGCEYHGSPDSGNVGWFFVEDSGNSTCKYETQSSWPTFLYSKVPTAVNYPKGVDVGYADIFAIFMYI